MDYGNKLLEAYRFSEKVQMNSIETILYGKSNQEKLITDLELDGFGENSRQIPILLNGSSDIKRVVIFNNLARHRYHVVKVVVNTPNVQVVGPSGEFVLAQVLETICIQMFSIIMHNLFTNLAEPCTGHV